MEQFIAEHCHAPITQHHAIRAMSNACDSDMPEAIEWVLKHFNLDGAFVRSNDMFVLRRLCRAGKLELAKWLVEYFSIQDDEIRKVGGYLMHHACIEGRELVVDWLLNEIGMPDAAIAEGRRMIERGRLGADGTLESSQPIVMVFDRYDAMHGNH